MIQVLFDTNVILDIALKRTPHFENATKLFDLIDQGIIKGNITATTITDIYFIAKKEKGHDQALNFISNLIEIIDIIGVDREIILKAIKSELKDFEDAIQIFASEKNGIEILITRNKQDFTTPKPITYSPQEFLSLYM